MTPMPDVTKRFLLRTPASPASPPASLNGRLAGPADDADVVVGRHKIIEPGGYYKRSGPGFTNGIWDKQPAALPAAAGNAPTLRPPKRRQPRHKKFLQCTRRYACPDILFAKV